MLTDDQKGSMAGEIEAPIRGADLFVEFESGLAAAEQRVRGIRLESWQQTRRVGRKQLPTTVAGLLIHCADHTQRHVGQAITTAKVILSHRRNAPA